MAGGGSTQTIVTAATVEAPWRALMDNTGGYTMPAQLNIFEAMYNASSYAGNLLPVRLGTPYNDIEPYDPDPELARVRDDVDMVKRTVKEINPQSDLEDYINLALKHYDDKFGSDQRIDLVMEAQARRSRPRFQRDIGNILDYAFSVGACMNSQLPIAQMKALDDRRAAEDELESRLLLSDHSDRSRVVMAIATQVAQLQLQKMASQFQVASLDMTESKLRVTAKMDELLYALDWEARDRTWDADLISDYMSVFTSIFGAGNLKKAPTKVERIMGAIGTSLNAGLQGGTALGSGPAGAAVGAASGALQLAGIFLDG